MSFFEWSMPYLKVVGSTIILLAATIFIAPQIKEGWTILSRPNVLIFLPILILAIFAPFWLKEGLDTLSNRDNAATRLDRDSLQLLASMDGLIFHEENSDKEKPDIVTTLALRHLTSLELIELDAFPISPDRISWGYHLTHLGRYILIKKLDKKDLYPEDFCEMIRVRYWKGYPERFLKEKNYFNWRHVSWDKCWNVFDQIMRELKPDQPQNDTITIFEQYAQGKSYYTIMKEVVTPWKNRIKRQ